jgi:hypothetical protein
MASRDFPGRGVVSNEAEPALVFAKVTFAADAEANGATVDRGSRFTTALTRTGEGLWTWDLADTYSAVLFVGAIGTKIDTDVDLVSDTVATDGKINIKFATAGVAADPDSAVVRLFAVLANSSLDAG